MIVTCEPSRASGMALIKKRDINAIRIQNILRHTFFKAGQYIVLVGFL
jgi:hypothetical protein